MVGESRRRKKTLQGNSPKGLIYRKVCPLFSTFLHGPCWLSSSRPRPLGGEHGMVDDRWELGAGMHWGWWGTGGQPAGSCKAGAIACRETRFGLGTCAL